MKFFKMEFFRSGDLVYTHYQNFEHISLCKDYVKTSINTFEYDSAKLYYGDNFEDFLEIKK